MYGMDAARIMTLQIYSDYNLPILPSELDWHTMRYFYDPMVDGLIKMQNTGKENHGR